MATRTRQRPAKDRVTAARQYLADANIAMGAHYTMCYQCSSAGQDTRRLCDTGWELAKLITARKSAVRHIEEPSGPQLVQGTLW